MMLDPRTRKMGPMREHTTIEDPLLLQLLKRLQQRAASGELIYGGSQPHLRKAFRLLLRALHLPETLYTPASLRSGGATWHWLTRRNLPELRLRGRWSSEKPMERVA